MTEPELSTEERVERSAIAAAEELRATKAAERPAWYSPVAHLLAPTFLGLGLCYAGVSQLGELNWLDWLSIPVFWVFSNFIEWHAHRDLLHTNSARLLSLYEGHTLNHHKIFPAADMAVRSRAEWREVLLPPLAVLMLLGLLLPVFSLFWVLGFENLALLYMTVGALYVLSYEWLHLSYHLDPEGFIGGLKVIRFLRAHHTVHHNPRFMKRWNMNVTIPLWDWVRGTSADEEVQAEAPRGG